MSNQVNEALIKAFLSEKKNRYEVFSDFVRQAQLHLYQLGILEESKHILKQYILDYFGFIEDAEFRNGELKKKKEENTNG